MNHTTTDLTVHYTRHDTVKLDRTTKQTHLVHAAINISQHIYSNVTEKLQKYKDLRKGQRRILQRRDLYSTISFVYSRSASG
jgi:hypothetical protein